jgi:hypothetical protein
MDWINQIKSIILQLKHSDPLLPSEWLYVIILLFEEGLHLIRLVDISSEI